MNRIDPKILRQLREQKGWSQEKLSEVTQLGRSGRIDKQTISRLERGLTVRTHERTGAQLALALNVEPDVLSGASPAPEMRAPNEYIQLKLQFAPEHRNAR
jgi:transcriptional regulator with XRE-family HTH domain